MIILILGMVCLVVGGGEEIENKILKCIPSEREALLQFKASILDYGGMLSSWNISDCCQWKGIRCSNLTRHVLMLHLPGDTHEFSNVYGVFISERYIRGKIHESLMELHQLQHLDLSSNSFQGNIPSQFGSLSNLKYLDLSQNYLEGSIPYQLGNLSNLQHLDLSRNSLEGKIPSQLGKLWNLHKLYLGGGMSHVEFYDSGLYIDGEGQWLSNLTSLTHLYFDFLPNLNTSASLLQMIIKLPKVRELSLAGCSLSDHFFLSLGPYSKFNFSSSLSFLDLSWNTFTSSSMIFEWVSNVSSNLIELQLSRNNLMVDSTSHRFGTIMNSLERLDLSSNNLKAGILNSFMNICTLRSLNMWSNNLTEDLPSILHSLSSGCARNSLQELDLSNNRITASLTDISVFSSLKTLDLFSNGLSGKIPEGSKLPPQLESLSVGSNSLEGGIPKSFGNVCTLHSLNMFSNSLSEELPLILDHLSGCARYSLQELDLGMNQINGTLPNLSMFSSLKRLYLHENKLNGTIPDDIQLPNHLEDLDIGSNSLKGVLTDYHFANMSELKLLDLSNNSFTLAFTRNWVPSFQLLSILLGSCKLGPTFPAWLQTQNQVTTLDISNGKISDNVPEWFWSKFVLLQYRIINISYNYFQGTIPNLPLRKTLNTLDFASNQFEGPIPPFLRGSASLDLSKNKFSDVQSFLCSNNGLHETLAMLDISNNMLSGQIPNCFSHFKDLAFLDLSHNNFSGKIPSSMGTLPELQVLLLRNNSLIGEMPFSLSSCTKLVMLDVGTNRLSGTIPSWIGSKLQELHILSLKRNEFSGSLPLQICYLQSIQLIDLSSNYLSGQIPKCFANFTFMAQKTYIRQHEFHYSVHITPTGGYMRDYDLNYLLTWKGVEQPFFNNELFLLKSIDLSSNQLSEGIPSEFENLLGLVSLNLSRNNLTGIIPSNIGRLTSLEFLDLSRNQISGSIPSSIVQIDRLAMLDLSHNKLYGEIPTGTQLQSFDASSYVDNLDLCGRPLPMLCNEGKPQQNPIDESLDENPLFSRGFYVSLIFGFVIGFWGSFGSILIKRSWRHAYFKFLNKLVDNIYVRVAMTCAKFQRL